MSQTLAQQYSRHYEKDLFVPHKTGITPNKDGSEPRMISIGTFRICCRGKIVARGAMSKTRCHPDNNINGDCAGSQRNTLSAAGLPACLDAETRSLSCNVSETEQELEQ